MATIGAVYCVYDASEFFEESVKRIYPLVDNVVFLLNFKPWSGDVIVRAVEKSYQRILALSDPDSKFIILSQYWKTEADQRNSGLHVLKNKGIDWCLVIDDDEMYNKSELENIFKSLGSAVHVAYLFYHQIYWKNRQTIIEGLFGSFPTLMKTNGLVYFNENSRFSGIPFIISAPRRSRKINLSQVMESAIYGLRSNMHVVLLAENGISKKARQYADRNLSDIITIVEG